MENINIAELVERLGSDEDAVRKMAVFKLQSNIGDPSFAEVFIASGGLHKLRFLALNATGNTLAYSLTSFSRLLEVDKGWDCVSQELIARVSVLRTGASPVADECQVVELVVTHPLVNILRGAMSILVAIVSHPQAASKQTSQQGVFGFRALKPAIAVHPQFLEMLVSRLSSADHALCANALQLINSLMRDAMTNDGENEWPRFIKRLQDLGVIKAVYTLMQSSALHDLAHPILEFQGLTKVLLRKWREVKVDLEKPDHRRALKGLHLASNPDRPDKAEKHTGRVEDVKKSRRHNPEKWRRLGFQTESPAWEFGEVGFLGMMDLTDFVRRHEDGFQKVERHAMRFVEPYQSIDSITQLLLEQSTKSPEQRCPVTRASLAVTSILYKHFNVGSSDTEEAKSYLALDSRTNFDNLFKPLLLQWSRLHTAGLQALFRMWKATGAELDDFGKVVELIKILIEQVVGQTPRTKDVSEVEEEIAEFDYTRLREMQMELLEEAYEGAWGAHLGQVREELKHEALQFVKEQRIRCLLQGAWFPDVLGYKQDHGPVTKQDLKRTVPSSWRYVRLSHNRRYLHYADFEVRGNYEPGLDMLPEKIDLSIVSSVVSNVSAASHSSSSSTETLTPLPSRLSTTKITIHGYPPSSDSSSQRTDDNTEQVLLTLHPQSHSLASEWLDGLLMLLNQQPITAETTKLINLVSNYGLKIRLLNVRFEDHLGGEPEMPGREGLDEDYYYEVFGGL